jgi:hypothetical protein
MANACIIIFRQSNVSDRIHPLYERCDLASRHVMRLCKKECGDENWDVPSRKCQMAAIVFVIIHALNLE